ncbi:hypothetical protein AXE80_10315 [Wenyingzhuangia fucanilytica]|uniref:Sulfatase N-terminal domain-containing protein n=2 Tax=Wenyingzhuangia fucanilytica TaxID=1790137 RepID=A0A1B1Y7D3_9FLAO|nr:hypothetical protein AXE80_10315 [Wenyingzhuangia fucanilytica]
MLWSSVIFSQEKKYNVLWIVTEDISPTLSMYGDNTAKTPNLDALAKHSMVYNNVFATVGVCAPSRSSIITGMQATAIGTMHMRTGSDITSWGNRKYKDTTINLDIEGKMVRQYSAVIPEEVKCFPEYLRAAGYYCTNNDKTDYQFAAPVTAWDVNDASAHWRNRPKGKPFFAVFNTNLTHESKLWKHEKYPLTVKPEEVSLPPYFPDTELSRYTVARNYSNIEMMDKVVGDLITKLKEDGLYDDTYIFFYSDHGGPLPRQKRAILDSGLKIPFLIKFPNSSKIGTSDRLISLTDLAPTMMSIAGIKPKKYFNGEAFLGKYEAKPRDYVFGSSDRFDEVTDRIRSVRNKQFLYLKNFYPEKTKYKEIGYRRQVPMMNEYFDLNGKGELNDVQSDWFQTKQPEELYDCEKDPFNIHNLANNPAYAKVLKTMRKAYLKKAKHQKDYGEISEHVLVNQMWPNGVQPVTSKPEFTCLKKKVSIECDTKGSSIAYLILDKPNAKLNFKSGWKLYTESIKLTDDLKGKYIYVMAERIGYKTSEIISQQL